MTNETGFADHLLTIPKASASTLLALAGRVEQAQGPDRLLDAEIHATVSVGKWGWNRARLSSKAGSVILYHDRGSHGVERAPSYTRSLDQVMRRLVPEGWRWMVGHRELPHARAYVENGELAFTGKYLSPAPKRNPRRQWYEVTAATPALALTAAALRAHAAMGGE